MLDSALRVPGGNPVDGLPPTRHRRAGVFPMVSITETVTKRARVRPRTPVSRRAGIFPMESNTKTIAKRTRVEPRTQMHMTMEKLF